MNKELKIEHYLLQLDRELQALPVSQRAEIITEIKSHIVESGEKDPTRDIDRILADLGAPRTVAERYLATKGIAYAAPRRSGRWLKWIAVGTVAFFAMIFFSGMMLIWYFSPLVKVDEEKGRVVLLGGLIDVNEKIGQVKIGDMVVNDALKDAVNVQGEENIGDAKIKIVKIPFNTAKLELTSGTDKRLSWDCKSATNVPLNAEVQSGVLTLNLDKLSFAKCAITLPIGLLTQIHGVNGDMVIDRPLDAMEIALDNGKVNIHPAPDKTYDFDVSVKNGLQDFFPRSNDKEAVRVKVNVVNGLVKKE